MNYPDNWSTIIKQIKRRDKYTCRKCFKKHPASSGYLQVHHIIPLSKGGNNDPSNLITLCKRCHVVEHPHMSFDRNQHNGVPKRYTKWKRRKRW